MEASTRVTLISILLVLINWNQENVFCNSQTTGRLIFEDNFDTNVLSRNWTREIKIPLDPEFQFCVYHKHDETVQINDGIIRIKPKLFDAEYGEDSVYVGRLRLADCTSSIAEECNLQASSYHILPPVISAKLITRNRFEFRYGVIEVRAKFPEGDWLYPEIYLEPLYKSFDERFANARINLGRARGNLVLTRFDSSHDDYGGRLLEFGVANGTGVNYKEQLVTKSRRTGGTWTKDFHTYKTTWTSKGFTFHVDGELVDHLVPTDKGWSRDPNAETSSLQPFDEKFYLAIGVGVGGVRAFPDNTQTNTYVKPWKNINAKAMLLFWQAKNKWMPTWEKNHGSKTALEIDYIRVWSLD